MQQLNLKNRVGAVMVLALIRFYFSQDPHQYKQAKAMTLVYTTWLYTLDASRRTQLESTF